MANICSNYLSVTGSKKDIKALVTKIKKQDKELIELFPWFEVTKYDYGMYKDSFYCTPTTCSFSFGSKWAFPDNEFASLVRAYPSLEFSGNYEEPGMEIFGVVSAIKGVPTVTDIEPLEYYTDNNKDFAEERECIEELPYEEFLKYVQETDYQERYDAEGIPYWYLDTLIIERIKPEDLPLFINKYGDNELFLNKLKGAKK